LQGLGHLATRTEALSFSEAVFRNLLEGRHKSAATVAHAGRFIRHEHEQAMNSKLLRLPASCMLIVGVIACPLQAQAAYVCLDFAGHTYRLPTPLTESAAIVCTLAPEPEPEPLPEHASLRPPAPAARPKAAQLPWRDLRAAAARIAPRAAPPKPPPVRRTKTRLQEPTEFDTVLRQAAERYEHDVNLLRAIVHVESGFDANAVSPKGAIGLMQVMPATARGLGLTQPTLELFDPARNVDIGSRYLRRLMNMFEGRPELAVAAYNAGENAVVKYGHSVPPYPETLAYVEKVRARYIRLRETTEPTPETSFEPVARNP
jgi:Transglycosylase SLT domain